MARLIVASAMTVDGVIGRTDLWFVPDGEHHDQSHEQLLAVNVRVVHSRIWSARP